MEIDANVYWILESYLCYWKFTTGFFKLPDLHWSLVDIKESFLTCKKESQVLQRIRLYNYFVNNYHNDFVYD